MGIGSACQQLAGLIGAAARLGEADDAGVQLGGTGSQR